METYETPVAKVKVLHLNYSDSQGGAHRAAYRIHRCLLDAGVESRMWVERKQMNDCTVEGPTGKLEKSAIELRGLFNRQVRRWTGEYSSGPYSLAILPSRWLRRINSSDADIVHLHWVAGEMLSIADISRIRKPLIWNLHDMWAFCGAEHYAYHQRWKEGYYPGNRPHHESGFDVNRWTWERKRRYWTRPFQLVADSEWLAGCIRKSALMADWPTEVISYPLDLEAWTPVDRQEARGLVGLPHAKKLILFGAMGGGRDPRKGFDLLLDALRDMNTRWSTGHIELAVFGQGAPQRLPELGFPIHFVGHLHDDLSLRLLYSAADVMVVPSRLEAFGQTASEAHACGTPVVVFDNSGLTDIVVHQVTGYLASAFDPEDLSAGIEWVLSHSDTEALRRQARARAEARFAHEVVAGRYRVLYNRLMTSALPGEGVQ